MNEMLVLLHSGVVQARNNEGDHSEKEEIRRRRKCKKKKNSFNWFRKLGIFGTHEVLGKVVGHGIHAMHLGARIFLIKKHTAGSEGYAAHAT